MKSVVVIGGGNLSESLCLALAQSEGVDLVQIYVRSEKRGAELSTLIGVPVCNDAKSLAFADIYILAVSDGAIVELSETLPFAEGAIVAHTAGSTPMSAISQDVRRGVFYPMQTFTRGRRVDFRSIPIFLEAEQDDVLTELRILADMVSDSVIELDSERRRRLHLSAVFVCNFANAMFGAGEELVRDAGLSFEILKPLIAESCSKACAAESPKSVQTGPAVRGDKGTQGRHIEMLDGKDNLKDIYKVISDYIWETSKKI